MFPASTVALVNVAYWLQIFPGDYPIIIKFTLIEKQLHDSPTDKFSKSQLKDEL